MKKYILQALICIFFTGCISNCPDTITVYYLHGFVDTNISKKCSEMKEMAMNDEISPYVKYDTICITHADFVRLKNYVTNQKVISDSTIKICSIDSRIVAVYDTLAVSFGDTRNLYGSNQNGEFVCATNEIVYLIKSLSGYYNYFDKEDLLSFFPEIKHFGIPKTYKRIKPPKVVNSIVEKPNPFLHSKIILIDSI